MSDASIGSCSRLYSTLGQPSKGRALVRKFVVCYALSRKVFVALYIAPHISFTRHADLIK